jgi:hypothetical protein
MGYPDGYPERFRESIFAWEDDPGDAGDPGRLVFVCTRGGGRINVYVFQYLGHHPSDGDLYDVYGSGRVGKHYDPSAEDNYLPEDMRWDADDPRLSQPLRRWLERREMAVADRDQALDLLAECRGFQR